MIDHMGVAVADAGRFAIVCKIRVRCFMKIADQSRPICGNPRCNGNTCFCIVNRRRQNAIDAQFAPICTELAKGIHRPRDRHCADIAQWNGAMSLIPQPLREASCLGFVNLK